MVFPRCKIWTDSSKPILSLLFAERISLLLQPAVPWLGLMNKYYHDLTMTKVTDGNQQREIITASGWTHWHSMLSTTEISNAMVECKWPRRETLVVSIGNFLHPKLVPEPTVSAPCGLGPRCFLDYKTRPRPAAAGNSFGPKIACWKPEKWNLETVNLVFWDPASGKPMQVEPNGLSLG